MADYNQIVAFTKAITVVPTSFSSTDGTTAKQIFAPADPASRINFITISSSAASQNYMALQVNNSATGQISQLGIITVPSGAGVNGSVSIVSGLNRGNLPWIQIDSDGNPFIDLNLGINLQMSMLTALNAGETITVTTSGGAYTA